MYNIQLLSGQILEIYNNYKDDRKYEGIATLIKFDKHGDTFYEDFEQLYVPEISKSSLKDSISQQQKELNKLYEFMQDFFKSVNPLIRSFKEELKKNCNRKILSYNKMHEICTRYRQIASVNKTFSLNSLFNNISDKNIIRYFQQKYIKNWKPTLFSSERWLVEFLPQYDEDNNILFNDSFRTHRYIKKLIKICPSEETKIDDLVKYTTYNGKTQSYSLDRNYDIGDDLDEDVEDDLSVDFLFLSDDNLIV